jgi:hypothetical protein
MNTPLMSHDTTPQTDRLGGRRLDSALRTVTVAVALLVFGFSAPMVFADHMGNHQRGPAESTESTEAGSGQACGQDIVDLPSTSDNEPGSAFSRGSRPW